MTKIKSDIKCPNCKKKNRIKLESDFKGEQISAIIDRSVFNFSCSACHESIMVDYPFKVMGTNYIVYYTPGASNVIEESGYEYMRVCDTFDDLKEKLLIFEDSLNDIIIEFIKKFLLKQLDEDIKKDVTDIRYDGRNEENLIFYLCGVKNSVGCPYMFYSELLKKSKIKKITKCINIDSKTFSSYFKLR